MRISAIQMQSDTGNIESNIEKHLKLIEAAVEQDSDIIFFPELSLTGYEPSLSESLATHWTDSRLDVFQQRSNEHDAIIGYYL